MGSHRDEAALSAGGIGRNMLAARIIDWICKGLRCALRDALVADPSSKSLVENTCCPLGRYGAPGRIRTHDPQIRSLVLYPTELRALLANHAGESLPQTNKQMLRLGRPALPKGLLRQRQG
jgi:hypothetical protein